MAGQRKLSGDDDAKFPRRSLECSFSLLATGSLVAVRVRGVPGVHMVVRGRRQIDDLPMAHAAFGDDVIGEFPHVASASLQDRHFHATLVIQMNVQRRLREIMMIVEVARQPFWQIALMVVVDINKSGDALLQFTGLR